jgi:Pyruvate/2-oxoacid:ferredoxin oxidoreductase gamma subunit
MEREILFTGIGGQGIQLAAQVLARAALAEGREVMLFGSYGGTMRGGHTDATLVVGDAPVDAPPIVSRAWSAIAMHPAYFPGVASKLTPGAVVVVNSSLFADPVAGDRWRVHAVPATQLATESGSALAGALVLVGAFAALTGLVALDGLVAGLAASLPERRRQHRELNERALRAGHAALPAGAAPAWPQEQGGRRSRPTRSPQGGEAAAQRGEAERSVGSREDGQASEGGPLHGGAA